MESLVSGKLMLLSGLAGSRRAMPVNRTLPMKGGSGIQSKKQLFLIMKGYD